MKLFISLSKFSARKFQNGLQLHKKLKPGLGSVDLSHIKEMTLELVDQLDAKSVSKPFKKQKYWQFNVYLKRNVKPENLRHSMRVVHQLLKTSKAKEIEVLSAGDTGDADLSAMQPNQIRVKISV